MHLIQYSLLRFHDTSHDLLKLSNIIKKNLRIHPTHNKFMPNDDLLNDVFNVKPIFNIINILYTVFIF